jgi:hypothetical protein
MESKFIKVLIQRKIHSFAKKSHEMSIFENKIIFPTTLENNN